MAEHFLSVGVPAGDALCTLVRRYDTTCVIYFDTASIVNNFIIILLLLFSVICITRFTFFHNYYYHYYFIIITGADLFHVRPLGNKDCLSFYVTDSTILWDPNTLQKTNDPNMGEIKCQSFTDFCPGKDRNCFESVQQTYDSSFRFIDLDSYQDSCLTCFKQDYIHGTIIFNAFIFCQVRKRKNDLFVLFIVLFYCFMCTLY